MRRRGDGTVGGVAIPLVVVAVVCLLVTSWAWLFSGDDGKSSSTARVSAEETVHPAAGSASPPAAASDRPTAAAASQTGAVGTSGSPSADPSATATATSPAPGGVLGPGPAPGPGSTPQPNGPAPDPAPGGGGTPAPPPPGGAGTTPPAATQPPSTPAGTQPRDIVVLVDRYATTGYIDIINPTDRPLASWKLTVVVSGSAFTVFRAEGNDGFVAHSSSTTATATSDRALLPHEELTVYFELKAPINSATCDLSGVACRF